MVSAHHHLGVVNQVEGEEDGPRPAIHHLHVLGVRDEDHHDAEDHEAAEEAHQDATHGRKVPFGLNMQVLKEGVISKTYDDTWKAKRVRATTIPDVMPTAIKTASTSYIMLTWGVFHVHF